MNPILTAALISTRPSASVFRGASSGRLTDDWYPRLLSADQELKADASLLRARSRQMVRDDPHAAGFVAALKDNVAGVSCDGIGLQARNRGPDGKAFDLELNRHLEERFKVWGMPETASADGRASWGDLQRLYVGNLAIDGEVLYRLLPGFDNAFGFAVQFLDPDQLADTLNRKPAPGVNEIRMGVEVDGWNRPVAYWLRTRHPSEGVAAAPERVPASEIYHDFIQLRPGQTRGLPWLTPALFTWRMLAGYTESEIVQARLAAATGGYFVATGTDAELWPDPTQTATPGNPDGAGQLLTLDVEPGVARQLPPGLQYQGIDPTHPNGNFKDFQKAMLMGISRALGPSYTSLSGNFENTNYSSGRMGLLPERDFYRFVARWIAVRFNRRTYEAWLKAAALYGAVSLPSLETSRYAAHEWQFRGWPWIDPLNDAQANERLLALGLTTRTRLAAEQGLDFYDLVDEQAEELAYAASKGVDVSGTDAAPVAPTTDDYGNPLPAAPKREPAEDDDEARIPRLKVAR